MGLSLTTNNKLFLVVGLIFELWFIILYAIDYEYAYSPLSSFANLEASINLTSIQGAIVVVFLMLLFFLGKLY